MHKCYYGLFFVIWVLLIFCVHDLYASPSGLNNIPTTDVVPKKTLVLQSWINAGRGKAPDYYSGLKYGVIKGMEIGIDGKLGSRNAGPAAGQIKYHLPIGGEQFKFKSLVGVENISSNSKRMGKVNPYAAFSYQLEPFRVHLGYNFQGHNDGAFAGADKTFQLFERDFTLRTDIKQTKDGHEVLGSFGFAYVLPWNFVFESWASFPSESKLHESFTAKLDYGIKF